MTKRIILGIIYCVVLYYAALFVVGVVAGNRAAVEPGQDAVAVRNQAAEDAADSSRHVVAFVVVGIVFLGTHFGVLPGTRAVRSPLSRR